MKTETKNPIISTVKGETTKTMQDLYKIGWRASTSGCMHYLYDSDNKKVLTAYSWKGLLLETEKLMR
jgi:Tat protein secretion system quality control protein TatD with DNase activity